MLPAGMRDVLHRLQGGLKAGARRFLSGGRRHRIERLNQDPETYRATQWRCPPKEFFDSRLQVASGLAWALHQLPALGIERRVREVEGPAVGQLVRDDIEILDAGARDGWAVELLASLGYPRVLGVELLEDYVDYARDRNRQVVCGDLHELDFEDERFDFVHCRHTLEHCHDPETALREILRVTRRGGALYASFPLEERARGKHAAAIPTLRALGDLLVSSGVESEILFLDHSSAASLVPESPNEAILFVRRPDR